MGSSELRIAAVWSREHTGAVGRSPTVQSIRQAMRRLGPIEEHVLSTVLDSKAIGPPCRASVWAAGSLFARRPVSLQTVLFADPARNRALAADLARSDPDVVYLDGVRTYPLFQALEGTSVRRVVVDFDDLMSRRMAEFRESGMVPLGYVGNSLPRWARTLTSQQALGRAMLGYERGMLERVERLMTERSDGVVLVSMADACLLRRQLSSAAADKVRVIPPCVDIVRPVYPAAPTARFVFLGSDRQSQNRLTIGYLLTMWESCRPSVPLVIAGPMVRSWPPVDNVTFTGWLEHTSDLYQPGTVMLTPSFIRGGIKTKVLAAFAHGCAAVGNDATFEGLPFESYPFRFTSDEQLREFLGNVPKYSDRLHEAAVFGQQRVREQFGRGEFDRAWHSVLSGVN